MFSLISTGPPHIGGIKHDIRDEPMTGTIDASGLIRITKSVQLLVGLELNVLFMFTEAMNESKW